MLLDHIGFYYSDVLPDSLVILLRLFGRLSFPLFAWSVARGFARTHNLLRYFLRLTFFAVLAEWVIQRANRLVGLQLHWHNVLFTFMFAIVALTGYRLIRDSSRDMIASLRPVPAAPDTVPVPPVHSRFDVRISPGGITLDSRAGLILGTAAMLAALFAAEWLQTDYGAYGVLTVLALYIATSETAEPLWEARIFQILLPLNLIFLLIRILSGSTPVYWAFMQLASLVAVPLMVDSRLDKKPPVPIKYGFYLFYPLHILVLVLIRLPWLGPFT
jgi:hypothetical protein